MAKKSAKPNSAAGKRKGASKTGAANRGKKAGQGAVRAGTIKRLQMYNKKPDRKRMKEQSLKPVRIQPDRRWFGNTRVIAQEKMQQFRDAWLHGSSENTWGMCFRSRLGDTESKSSRMDLLSVSPYQEAAEKAAEGYGEGHAAEEIFNKGTSRRIWGELYKVILRRGSGRAGGCLVAGPSGCLVVAC
eukprot:Skav207541  [mRNA]  locus=C9340441:404:4541:- [translate_table: standard]